MKALALLVIATSACTTVRNPAFCASDEECTDPAAPICDLDGAFSGTRNHCVAEPDDCPVERCGCTPGESLACDVDQLTVCAADGLSTELQTCALGCSTEDRCLTFEPSNGLGPALEMAVDVPDVMLVDGVKIDTGLGTVIDNEGNSIDVPSIVVEQEDAPPIRAFIARSFVIGNVSVEGGHSLAIVASQRITLAGILDASADGRRRGPGANDETSAQCVEESTREQPTTLVFAPGGGGGGGATQGGNGAEFGGVDPGSGGAVTTSFVPLVGGCSGGDILAPDGTITTARGGAGGGAVQLVSLDEVAFVNSGLVHVGAGGGETGGGGGSGGIVVIEAPRVRFDGSATGITANGGAGGGCGEAGADGTASTAPASAPDSCTTTPAPGDGGTGASVPRSGEAGCGEAACFLVGNAGGGGGAAGRALIRSVAGIEVTGAPVFSVKLMEGALPR